MTTLLAAIAFGLMLLFGLGFPLLIAFVVYLCWLWARGTTGEPDPFGDHMLQDPPQIDPDHASDCGDCN